MRYPVKLLMVSLLLSVLLASCCVFPDWGQGVYTRGHYTTNPDEKKAMVLLRYSNHISYYYDHKRVQIWFQCDLKNATKDTILFNRQHFSLQGDKTDYTLEPMLFVNYNVSHKTQKVPDIFKIAPSQSLEYQFSFHSKNKMTRKEYNTAFKENLSFVYSDSTQTDTIFISSGTHLRKR